MKRILIVILSGMSLIGAVAQTKVQKAFKMPPNTKFVNGSVLVKVKEEYKDAVSQMADRNAVAAIKNVSLKSVHRLAKKENKAVVAGARKQKLAVDISKYFALKFDANQNVEDYINQLYATGYFEIVEPEYEYRTFSTPNDPFITTQYYLNLIKAFDAWDITQGDTAVVIAIIDEGGNLTHSDLVPNLFRNWHEIPNNGIDDDGNGFVDDYRGWDFIGSLTANRLNPDSIGDNNPSVKSGEMGHGTWVAGCASAATDNSKGIAGVGYKTKLMFTKHTGDDEAKGGLLYNTYAGLVYAADLFSRHNIRGIINCSFGGLGRSQICQDMINHVVLDQNCVVVAAAGNSNSDLPSYPAAYDNVLSVTATDQNEVRASFSNYGSSVDLSAPGVWILTTNFGDTYGWVEGTSFSSPITAGAAALVWAKNPAFSAQQVMEQLRVTADAQALYKANPDMIAQLGKGRLDIQRALTLELPSIRASNLKVVNQYGLDPRQGDNVFLSFDFKNYLKSTSSGLTISISAYALGSDVTISKNKIAPGVISEGATLSTNLTPFELKILTSTPDAVVDILITYTDGIYTDYQHESFDVNRSFIDVNSNQIGTTVTSIGRVGFQDTGHSAEGVGFIFDNHPMLFEMGLIMGTSVANLSNNVRGINNGYDEDFSSIAPISLIIPGQRSSSEIFGRLSTPSQLVYVDYRSLVMKEAPYDKFVILEYKVKNRLIEDSLYNFYFGIFSDWDISTEHDRAVWDGSNTMGYVYPVSSTLPLAGIQLLTGRPGYYAIDNDSLKTGGTSFGIYDGFTHAEKFEAISATIASGKARLQTSVSEGDDVSQVVSSGPYNIAPGGTITIAFAIHAATNLSELQTSARYADSLYNYTMLAAKAIAAPGAVTVCYNSPATLNASGANSINWYTSFAGGVPIFNGTQYTTGNLKRDTIFYVSNADHSYESVRTAINVKVKANPKISLEGPASLCQGDTLTLSVARVDSTIWNTGQTTNTIEVVSPGKYAVRLKDNSLACASKSDTVTVTFKPKPTADFTASGDLETLVPISFTDQSTDAVDWAWDFGDGHNSTNENPVHTYHSPASAVKLFVAGANGCPDTKTSRVDVVTAIEDSPLNELKIYPNPVFQQDLQVVIDNQNLSQSRLVLTNSLGQVVMEREISTADTHFELTIPSASLNEGLNILKLSVNGKTEVHKVIKVH